MALKALGMMPPPRAPEKQEEVMKWAEVLVRYLNDFIYSMDETVDALVAGAVSETELADSAVTSAKIQDSAITTLDLQDSSITTVKIANSSVTAAKIADGTLTSSEYGVASIYTASIQDSAITTVLIQNSAVTNTELVILSTGQATTDLALNSSTTLTYTISRTNPPLVVARCTALGWVATVATVSAASVEVNVLNSSTSTAGVTVYINYH